MLQVEECMYLCLLFYVHVIDIFLREKYPVLEESVSLVLYGPMAYGNGKNGVILVIIEKVFQATEFIHLCYYVLFIFSIKF